ncbi:MAG: ABC transporter substrate-binding protein [Halopseudomonas sp.]
MKTPNIVISLLILLLTTLQGCSDESPIRIGFIAGTSGRVADLGVGGRNGAILAVEQFNAAGGIDGRQVELLIRDDQQNATLAAKHANELVELKVAAILGPMTSSMAKVVEPITTAAKVLTLASTVTTNDLTAKDDYFFRTLAGTQGYARKNALYQINQGINSFAIAFDSGNLAYTRSWSDDFAQEIENNNGEITLLLPFKSSEQAPFPEIARQLVNSGAKGIALICNSVDAALLAQHIRKLDTEVALVASEWAGTERLIELGGQAIEGITVAQFMDRYGQQPAYIEFSKNFVDRFGDEPGYPALLTYNAANIVLKAMQQQTSDEHLKQTLLRIKTFQGVQEPLTFDAYGDSQTRTFITQVIDGQFRVVK